MASAVIAIAPEALARCVFLMAGDTLPPAAADDLRLPFVPYTFLSAAAALMSLEATGFPVLGVATVAADACFTGFSGQVTVATAGFANGVRLPLFSWLTAFF